MLVLGRIRRWVLGNVCHRSITSAGGLFFFLVLGLLFFFSFFQQKIIEIFTGCDDDVFVELPK